MSDCNNNNIVSVERDICTGIGNNTIHQLNKLDEKLGKRKRVRIYPITYIQAVYDAKTGTRLDGFLNMVNSIYLPWRGSAKSTRLQVPFHLRRKGLMISYRNIDNEIITEKCILEECIKDDLFKLDSSWVRITDALPVSGNVTIGSNGNWFVDGEDTGFKAQGPKGDNGVPLQPRLSEDGTKIEYSLDGEEWKELFPLSMEDVRESFDYYLEHYNNGRPFVLAGFSQGGKAVVELVKHLPAEAYGRMAAAYAIGYRISDEELAQYPQLLPATDSTGTGTIICYNSVACPEAACGVLSPSDVCINPVNWTTDATPAILNDSVTVTVDTVNHLLIVDGLDPEHYYAPSLASTFPLGNYHLQELTLYQEHLRRNTALRLYNFEK